MSAGAFKTSKYESNDGFVYPITIQPETEDLVIGGQANDPPGGALTAGALSVRVSGGKRSIGLVARKIRVRFTGAVPSGYQADGVHAIPVLDPEIYASYKDRTLTGTYLSSPIRVVGWSGESGTDGG